MANWLDKYEQGGLVLKKKTKDNYGKKANPNDVKASVGPDFVGLGYNTKGRDYSPSWGGRFQMGGSMPGAVGFTYARTAGSAPANGKYTKKTKASAQNGQEMKFYQEGLDFKPKSISKNGSVIKDDRGQWAYPGEITEIGSNDITMQGVDYPVLGVSDTGDTQMMYPDQDYKFDGKKVTEYPMAQNGDWLSKYQPEPMRQDATRNVVLRKMTDKERLKAVAISDQAQKRALNSVNEVITERQKNRATKGDLNTPGSWHIEDKARSFPNSVGGAGEIFDEYINPATYVGLLADALGESVAARDPKGIATSLALSALGGALGFDPLGGSIKAVKSFVKPSFTNVTEAVNFLQSRIDNIGEENLVNVIAKKTGKTKAQIKDEFTQAFGNADIPRDPEYIIRQANMLNGKFNLPKFPKSLKELDEKAGELVSSPSNINFDKTEIIDRANELLEQGVGIKKKNIPIKLESKYDDYNVLVNVGESDVSNITDAYTNSGYMRLQPNFSGIDTRRQTFTEWLQGKKPEPKFMSDWGDIIETDPVFIKVGDFPYDKKPSLKGTGIGAEAAEAIKQALEEKGVKLVSSTNHTQEGRLRYLTEYLNDRKKAINTEYSPKWLNAVNEIKDNLKGKKVSKSEVKNLMELYPEIDPKLIQFQYKDGGWLNKYK